MFEAIFSVFRTKDIDTLNSLFVGREVSIKPEFFAHIDSLDTPRYGWRVRAINGKLATLELTSGKPGKLFIESKYLNAE